MINRINGIISGGRKARLHLIEAFAHYTRYGCAYSAIAKPCGAIILMYHSVAGKEDEGFVDPANRISPNLFERQMEFLSRRRNVIPLSRLAEIISSGNSPNAGTVCLSFDDGYLDNLTIAAPILSRYNLPATIYLATGYIERSEPQWADVLFWIFNQRTFDRLAFPVFCNGELNLTRPAERRTAYRLLHKEMLEASYPFRKELIVEVGRQLKPEGRMNRVTMNWDEVRQLVREYPQIDIGGHTRNHIDLGKIRGSEAEIEILGCRDDIARETGQVPNHFSFPYGRWCLETQEAVRANGWQSAVGASDEVRADKKSDKFALPRIEAPQSMRAFQYRTSAAHPGALEWMKFR